jgi:hypothetical protein
MAAVFKPRGGFASRYQLNRRFSRSILTTFVSFLCLLIVFEQKSGGLLRILAWRAPPEPQFYDHSSASSFVPYNVDPAGKSPAELCATFPKHILNVIQPVLKMGHGEDRAKINAQLDSVSACFEDDELLVFSDLEEEVKGRHVVDILADLPEGYYSDNPDFINYLWQKEMKSNGTLDTDMEATKRINGWILDKYKFLPMIERAWKTKPGRDFYFFFETDT